MKKVGFILFLGIIAIGAYFGYQTYFSTNKGKTTTDNNSIVSVYLSDSIPQNLSTIIADIADQKDWTISNDTGDINVGGETSGEIKSIIYQFMALTKPWSELAQSDIYTFSEISELIDQESFENLDQEIVTYDENSNSENILQTFSELDGTRLTVDIDEKSIFDPSWWQDKNYPLTLEIQISGNEKVDELISELELNEDFTASGYTTEYLSSDDFVEIIKTGTTVAGGPGWELCERVKGSMSYPIDEVKELLENADISMISNESSFVEGCSQGAGTTAFCGKPSYLQNLLDMGIDIVSLTGNHMSDYGRDYFTETLDLYTENDIQYFAAGKNSEEAWEPLIIETTAGSIAFIGINKMGPDGIIATEGLTGTAYYVQETFIQKLDEVADNVDIVWLDTHLWPEYGTTPTQEQITVTQIAIDHGVDIITGVSSHEPQGIGFYEGKPIFYGLGNFLFDQMWSAETRLGMVVQAYMFNGKIVDINVLPTRLYDYCQPRVLEGDDKTSILEYFVGISEL